MWNVSPNTRLVSVDGDRATLEVPLSSLTFDAEGHPRGGADWSVEDYDATAGWALIDVPANEVEGLFPCRVCGAFGEIGTCAACLAAFRGVVTIFDPSDPMNERGAPADDHLPSCRRADRTGGCGCAEAA
jgi:hypothetical protein